MVPTKQKKLINSYRQIIWIRWETITDNYIPLSPVYQVYSDLGYIDPESVENEEQEDLYYKSLLWGCKKCDMISENRMYMVTHYCSRNGNSKYE
jgi:hypothetical protein